MKISALIIIIITIVAILTSTGGFYYVYSKNLEICNKEISKYVESTEDGVLLSEANKIKSLEVIKKELTNMAIKVTITTVFIFAIVGFIIGCIISKPIKKLTQNVKDITQGRLDIQLERSKISEVQNLINSLNRILASLKLAILRTNIKREDIGIGVSIENKESTPKSVLDGKKINSGNKSSISPKQIVEKKESPIKKVKRAPSKPGNKGKSNIKKVYFLKKK